jgi:hypothetical protein
LVNRKSSLNQQIFCSGGGMGIRTIVLISVLTFLAGCATAPQAIKVEGFSPVSGPAFTLVDARPMEIISGGRRENSYSVWWVYGDDQISPAPLSLMRSSLSRILGQQLSGKTVKVEKIEVSLTRAKAGARQTAPYVPSSGSLAADLLGGLLAGVIIGAIEDAKNGPMIATEIVIEIDEQKFEHSERDYQVSGEIERRLAENLVKAVDGAVLKIGETLKPKADESLATKDKP